MYSAIAGESCITARAIKMTQHIREQFVVVADDYGIRQTAEPILRLAEEGRVDRVSVLIHYVSVSQAQALQKTGVKIDLHLELIHTLKSGSKMYANVFSRACNFVFRYGLGLITKEKVRKEWEEQIVLFEQLFGRMPDGLNSHEHVHYFPSFFGVYVALAQEYNISHIRYGKKGLLTHLHGALTGKILSLFWARTEVQFLESGRTSTDYQVSFDWVKDFPHFCAHLPEGSIELVVHPEREEEYLAIQKYF